MITKDTKVGDVVTTDSGDTATVAWYSQFSHTPEYMLLILQPHNPVDCYVLLNAVLLPTHKTIEELEAGDEELITVSCSCESPVAVVEMVELAVASITSSYYNHITEQVMKRITGTGNVNSTTH